jgi:hypothetical protein
MNKKTVAPGFVFFGLLLMFLFSSRLSAQSGQAVYGYDENGKAITAILPFSGEAEPAETFDEAVAEAVVNLQKYSPRIVSRETVSAAGVRIPTDMPPIRELVPGARFALTGGVYPGNYLQLWLWDMASSSMIYSDDLVYEDLDEGLESLPGLVEWLFSHITEVPGENAPAAGKDWEEQVITAGVRSGVSQRWYTEPEQYTSSAYSLNFEGDLFISVRLNSLLSLQAEFDFNVDQLVYRGIDDIGGVGEYIPALVNEKYTSYSLMFPVLFKVNFRPGNFRLAPFGGIYAFIPLGSASYRKNSVEDSFSWSSPAPLGYILGLEGAMKLGPGLLLADIRYGEDFGAIAIQNDTGTAYRRGILSLTLGYAFGFIRAVR